MWNMLKVNNKDTRTTSIMPVLFLLTLTYFRPFSSVSIVDFQQVNVIYSLSTAFHETTKNAKQTLETNVTVFVFSFPPMSAKLSKRFCKFWNRKKITNNQKLLSIICKCCILERQTKTKNHFENVLHADNFISQKKVKRSLAVINNLDACIH